LIFSYLYLIRKCLEWEKIKKTQSDNEKKEREYVHFTVRTFFFFQFNFACVISFFLDILIKQNDMHKIHEYHYVWFDEQDIIMIKIF
jgi:hypothetical protein